MAKSLVAVHTYTSNFIENIEAKMPLLILETDYLK